MYRSLLALLGVLLFSCSDKHANDDVAPTGRKIRVDFSIAQDISRATMDNSYNSSFSLHDEIGLFASGGANAANVKYTVAENNKLTTGSPIVTDGSGAPCDFYAYHPYNSNYDGTTAISLAVNTDQSTEKAFLASDFLTASAENITVVKDQPVKLAFKHRMAMIELAVVMPDGQGAPLSVRLTNLLTHAQWVKAGDQLTSSGDPASVTMLSTGSTTRVYRAIVPEQTIAQNTPIFTIETIIGTYTFTTTQDIELKSNFVKKFKVGIGTEIEGTESVSAEVTISSWTIDDEVITGSGVETPANYLIRENFETPFTLTVNSFTKGSEWPTESGWYTSRYYVSDPIASIIDDPTGSIGGKVLALHTPTHKQRFTHAMVGYFSTQTKPGKYRMRARVTSNSDAKPDSEDIYKYLMTALVFKIDGADGSDPKVTTYFANATSPDGSMETTTLPRIPLVDTYNFKNEYRIITADVDLTEVYKWGGSLYNLSSEKTTPTPDMYNAVLFFINGDFKTYLQDLYIDNITIELIEEQ